MRDLRRGGQRLLALSRPLCGQRTEVLMTSRMSHDPVCNSTFFFGADDPSGSDSHRRCDSIKVSIASRQ
jgi:hypothetical protein